MANLDNNLLYSDTSPGYNDELSQVQDVRRIVGAELIQKLEQLDSHRRRGRLGGFELNKLFSSMEGHQHDPRAQLWGPFWYERELAILAGRTGAGKSALAMQIALAIASGDAVGGFGPEREGQPVLYIDFENELDDYIERMYNTVHKAKARENLYRLTWEPGEALDTLNTDLIKAIRAVHRDEGVNVVVLDNISWLLDFGNNRKDIHERTAELMQRLDHLCKQEGVAVLVVAHTTKAKGFEPFELGDIAGSSSLQKYVRSIFALGEIHGHPRGRYLKQLKSRKAEKTYVNDVAAFELSKMDGLLHLVRCEGLDGPERNFLKAIGPNETKAQLVEQYLQDHPNATLREVAAAVGCSHELVRKVKGDAV
jgi:hypothetical protein